MSGWNYRTVKHVNRDWPDEEEYLTVHETFCNSSGLPWGFSVNAESPQTKQEVERMALAFDKEPIALIYDETKNTNVAAFTDYEWEWLVPHEDCNE